MSLKATSPLNNQKEEGKKIPTSFTSLFFQCLRFFHSVHERDMGARIELDSAFVQHP